MSETAPEVKKLVLPTSKTPPRTSLSDLTVLIWGKQKIGKSTFCSQSDGALFLATEAGLNSLDVYQTPIHSWDELLEICTVIAAGNHSFRTIIIDTVDNAYRFCTQYILAKYKIDHESDLGYGKGWALINNEFYRVLNKLSLLPYGLFLTSHAQEKEIETRTGKYTKMMPTLPDKARKIVLGMVDIILYADLEEEKDKPERRVIYTTPSKYYEAGDRTGTLPEVLDLDYLKFAEAFVMGTAAKKKAEEAQSQASKPKTTASAAPAAQSTAPAPAPAPSTAQTQAQSSPQSSAPVDSKTAK